MSIPPSMFVQKLVTQLWKKLISGYRWRRSWKRRRNS